MGKMNFKVKNITHLNDEGKDTQKMIKRIVHDFCEDDEKWEGFSNADIKESDLYVQEYPCNFDIKLEYGEYEEKERLKVFIKDVEDEWHNVGIVPPSIVKEYEEKKKDAIRISMYGELTGGKIKKSVNYGESVEIVELTYGIEITVTFMYENDLKKQETKTDNNFMEENNNIINNTDNNKSQNTNKAIIWIIIGIIILIALINN